MINFITGCGTSKTYIKFVTISSYLNVGMECDELIAKRMSTVRVCASHSLQ